MCPAARPELVDDRANGRLLPAPVEGPVEAAVRALDLSFDPAALCGSRTIRRRKEYQMSSTREMGQGAGALSRGAAMVDEARHDLDVLERQLAAHLAEAASAWGGQGSVAFQALGRAWSTRQRTIVAALSGFAVSLRSSERDNTTTDHARSTAFERTHRRLG